jgi:hypothetical protein
VLRTDRRGLPLAYTWVPANEHEYEPLLDLVGPGETVIADKVECPRFGGQLSAGLSGPAERLFGHATEAEVSKAVSAGVSA